MSQRRLPCAVVGVGYLGRFHAQKFQLIEEAELCGVFDADQERCKEVAKELGVKAFSSLDEVVSSAKAVTVATSTPAHYEVVKQLLERGCHVQVEKPMTSTTAQAEEIVELSEKLGLKLQVGHVERFNPAMQAVKGRLSEPRFIECHRLAAFQPRGSDVSVILDLMIHDLDVILSLVKSPVLSVAANGTAVLTKSIDIANARIEFESGAVANVTCSRVSQSSKRKFRIFQTDQYLSLDFGTGEVNLLTKTGEWKEGEIPLEVEEWNLEKGDALLAETQDFVRAILDDRPCQVSGRDGLVALRLAEQIINDIERRL